MGKAKHFMSTESGMSPAALVGLRTTRVAITGHYDVHLTERGFIVTQQWDGLAVRGIFAARFRALEEAEALEARYLAGRPAGAAA